MWWFFFLTATGLTTGVVLAGICTIFESGLSSSDEESYVSNDSWF